MKHLIKPRGLQVLSFFSLCKYCGKELPYGSRYCNNHGSHERLGVTKHINTTCAVCGSTETAYSYRNGKRASPHWFTTSKGYLCQKCFVKSPGKKLYEKTN